MRFVLLSIEHRRIGLGGHSDVWFHALFSILACFSEVLSVFVLLKIVGDLCV